MKKHAFFVVLAVAVGGMASGQDLPRGQIIDDVQCKDDASQHYVLYVPSTFTPLRLWPVILAFDAGGRGRLGVERYEAAAEKYGYIVAGSNNARNGPWEIGLDAADAMTADIKKRFPVDPKRMYTAGMSGGARLAILVALNSASIAGVFASSAGFADGFHESVRFPIFGSAGTDDFNNREMRQLDRGMKSPHRVEVFEGGHTWLPVELAMDGVEWMEIQAMKSGLRPRDQKLIDELFAKRMGRAAVQKSSLEKMRELKRIAVDFQSLKDVAEINQSAAALEGRQDVNDALGAERSEEERERQITDEVYWLRSQVTLTGGDALARLKARVTTLLQQSRAAEDSPDRRIARRVLTGLRAPSRGIPDPEFQELLNQIRPPGQPSRPQ